MCVINNVQHIGIFTRLDNSRTIFIFAFAITVQVKTKTIPMKGKVNKNNKSNSLKTKVGKPIINKLRRVTIGYGNLKSFSDRAGLNYNTVSDVMNTELATRVTRKKIVDALNAG